MKNENVGRELESVTKLFISSNGGKNTPANDLDEPKDPPLDDETEGVEVEETIHIRKKVAFPATRKARESMRNYLFERLQESYIIKRIELIKTTDVFRQDGKTTKEEEIIVVLKDA